MSTKLNFLKEIKSKVKKILEMRQKKNDWSVIGRKEQQMPENFHVWMILAGRGFGKTRAGSEAVKKLIQEGYKNICIIGETMTDTRKVMVEGSSGLLKICNDAKYFPSKQCIQWPNGAKVHLFSAEQPDALRGPQFDAAWIDELAKFQYPEECWNQIMFSVRLGSPKIIVTTTPRPIPIIRKLCNAKNVVVTRGSTLDNRVNLSTEFVECILEEYGSTKFGKQEIYGEILEEQQSVLWHRGNIKYGDSSCLEEVVISVDPAMSANQASDETGIIVAGKDFKGCFYIIKDYTGKFRANEWPQFVVSLYYKFNASKIVVEVNQGGDLISELLLQVDPEVSIESVRAVKSKFIRAQAAAVLYDRNQVLHCEKFEALENQMLNFEGKVNSPDRVDALVWALTYLKRQKKELYIF